MVNFGERLRTLRQRDKLTQDVLAQKLGITKSEISAYENGMRYPSYQILIKIASEFKVTTDFLLGLEAKKSIDLSGLTERQQFAVFQLIKTITNK